MRKSDLIKTVATEAGITQQQARDAVDALTETIQETVAGGEKVSIPGFGTFESAQRPAREGFNHLTKKPFSVPATTVPKFRAGDTFKAAVAGALRSVA